VIYFQYARGVVLVDSPLYQVKKQDHCVTIVGEVFYHPDDEDSALFLIGEDGNLYKHAPGAKFLIEPYAFLNNRRVHLSEGVDITDVLLCSKVEYKDRDIAEIFSRDVIGLGVVEKVEEDGIILVRYPGFHGERKDPKRHVDMGDLGEHVHVVPPELLRYGLADQLQKFIEERRRA
jgi:hypothetical protein